MHMFAADAVANMRNYFLQAATDAEMHAAAGTVYWQSYPLSTHSDDINVFVAAQATGFILVSHF